MSDRLFSGIIPVITTAVDANGSILEQPIRDLIDHLISRGAHGLAGLGEGSGFHKLSVDERLRLTEVVLEQVRGRVPVMIGTSANNLPEAILFARAAQSNGADAVFAMPPYLAKLRDEQIRSFYHRLADAVDTEIIIQDNMMSTGGGSVGVPLMIELASDIPTITYIKEENPPTGARIAELRQALPDRVGIITGNGGKSLMSDLKRGAAGCMPGAIAVPGLIKVYEAYSAGEPDRAYEIFERTLPIIMFASEHYGPGTTEILRRKGIFPTSFVRPPCAPGLDEAANEQLSQLLMRAKDLV
ncbi:MAG: dihydrodipicolinate synthase family protein [Trueperaceae bacterium]